MDRQELRLRDELARFGASLFARGFSVGTAGNLSVRLDAGVLITPTNSSLGSLEPGRISKLDDAWRHVGGDPPSKEVPMHRAFYVARGASCGAVVHLHSPMATAIACLADVDPLRPIPPLTPYFLMRIGATLPLVPYLRPGDPAMEQAIAEPARGARAVLLGNHGPVVSGGSLAEAVAAAEELEEAAKLALLLQGRPVRLLTEAQIAELVR